MVGEGEETSFQGVKDIAHRRAARRVQGSKQRSKSAVAMAKGKKYNEVYEKLGTREGRKEVYRIARSRAQKQRDVGNAKCVRDEDEEVLVMDNKVHDHGGDILQD